MNKRKDAYFFMFFMLTLVTCILTIVFKGKPKLSLAFMCTALVSLVVTLILGREGQTKELKDKVSKSTDEFKEKAEDAGKVIKEDLKVVKDKTKDAGKTAKKGVKKASKGVQKTAKNVKKKVNKKTK